MASIALIGFAAATPAAAAKAPAAPPAAPAAKAPRAFFASAILTPSAAPAAAGATGKAVFKISALDGIKTLEVDVAVPLLANATVMATINGTTLGAIPLNPLGAGSVTFATAGLPPAVVSPAVAGAGAGSKITVTTNAGALLLSGVLK